MEEITQEVKQKAGRLVHELSAHSYSVYLVAVVAGFGLDVIFPQTREILTSTGSFGAIMIVLGTIFVFWARGVAQSTKHVRHGGADGKAEVKGHHFHVGPYCITRAPTQLGLFCMTLGLALLYHSLFMTVFTLVAFLVSRFVFVPKREEHLFKKYGQAFLEYKKKVHF